MRPGPWGDWSYGRHDVVAKSSGRHSVTRRRSLAAPLVAFLSVVALAFGGWVLLGRGAPADPSPAGRTAALTGTDGGPGERGSRDGAREAAPPALGGLRPAPATTQPASPTAAPTTSAAPGPNRPRPTRSSSAPPVTTPPPPPPAPTAAPPPPPGSQSITAEVTRLTNVERAKAGCGALRTEAKLAAAALAHSRDMVARNYFSHTSPDGKGPGARATAAGYANWSGENIAKGYPSAAAVVKGWMNSPGHRANILNCSSESTGVGYDPRQNMWTQMFGFV